MSRERRERTTPLMVGRVVDELDSAGATTARYPSEGDDHAMRGWNDVLLDNDELEPTRRRRGGSVDKVPRRPGAVFALVIVCICLVLGTAVAVFAVFGKGDWRSWLKLTSQEPAAMSPPKQTPAEPPRAEPQPIVPPPAQPAPQAVAQPRAPARAPAAVPVAVPKPQNAAVQPDVEGAERLRQDAAAVRRRRQRNAEKDLVWSQELKMLVPAEFLEHPPAQPSAAPAK
jgi:hypothetical protein